MSFVKDCAGDAKNAGICQAIIDLAHHFRPTPSPRASRTRATSRR